MPHWRTLIEKDHLGSWDLVDRAGAPRDYTLEITKVESKLLKTREQPKGKRRCVITFKGAQKAFVCNTTNAEIIEAMFGSDTNGWIGKRITLYQTKVKNPKGGEPIPGIRVRPRAATGPAESIESQPVDEAQRAQQNEAFDRSDEGGAS